MLDLIFIQPHLFLTIPCACGYFVHTLQIIVCVNTSWQHWRLKGKSSPKIHLLQKYLKLGKVTILTWMPVGSYVTCYRYRRHEGWVGFFVDHTDLHVLILSVTDVILIVTVVRWVSRIVMTGGASYGVTVSARSCGWVLWRGGSSYQSSETRKAWLTEHFTISLSACLLLNKYI